jgi:hypothetical protein
LTGDDSSDNDDDDDDDEDVDIHCYERTQNCNKLQNKVVSITRAMYFLLIFQMEYSHGQNLEDVDGMLDEFITNYSAKRNAPDRAGHY